MSLASPSVLARPRGQESSRGAPSGTSRSADSAKSALFRLGRCDDLRWTCDCPPAHRGQQDEPTFQSPDAISGAPLLVVHWRVAAFGEVAAYFAKAEYTVRKLDDATLNGIWPTLASTGRDLHLGRGMTMVGISLYYIHASAAPTAAAALAGGTAAEPAGTALRS